MPTPTLQPTTTPHPFPILGNSNTDRLAQRLRETTTAEVRFTPGERALYASDLSHYRQVPIGVVIPRSVDDVIHAVAACREFHVPLLGRGAGTSLAGQTCNAGVVLDFSKYLNQIEELNPKKRYAWVQPGLINDDLRNAAEKHALTFAPDPATHAYCTLGGMIGNNSCGAHSVLGGKTSENVEELDILLYDGTRMTVGATSESELNAIIKAGGRRGEIYAALRNLRDVYAGRIRKTYPDIPRRVSGYNLDYLLPENGFHVARALVGTESTCCIILRAKTRLIHSPQHRVLLLIGYPTVFDAGDASPLLSKLKPIAIEGFQRRLIDNERLKGKSLPGIGLFPEDADAYLLVEFGSDDKEEAISMGRKAELWAKAQPHTKGVKLLTEHPQQKAAMEVRELGVGASRVPGKTEDTWDGWEDAAVEPAKLGHYLRDFYALADRYNYFIVLYGHFGQGCMHCRLNYDLKTTEGVAKYRSFVTEAAHLVVKHGGSLSGEHGDGQARAELLPIMFGPELVEAFGRFKAVWDPTNRMNPGKIVHPYPLDSNLRVGPDYKPLALPTIFQFPDDAGSMAQATERCFGVGKCRKLEGGTMCPSFHATREEKHTTRGRARLLFEMLRGDSIPDTWRNEEVKDALDLCLACKGCKGDCPVSVDIATYKAEFLAHYYEGRLRPNYAYSMGLIDKWAALASNAPALANFASQTPILRSVVKKLGGITQHRDMPTFPNQTFKQWLADQPGTSLSSRPKRSEVERPAVSARGPQAQASLPTHTPMLATNLTGVRGDVILWADTFNNYLTPHTAKSALAVLADAGFRVHVPQEHLCCGRPLYDFGMLDEAKRYLRKILTTLAPEIRKGTPIVVLEPSCASVFKDELTNLFPKDEQAQKLSDQIILFPDFLHKVGYKPRALTALTTKAIVHGHCHHKALWSMTPEHELLTAAGLQPQLLDSGCCGLAGSFGYEEGHHDISMTIGNKVLLPKVREATPDTFVIADGFSCRQQIDHGTPRKALHTAEVLALGLHPQPQKKPRKKRPIETGHTQPEASNPLLPLLATAAVAALYLLTRNRAQAKQPSNT